ncbi:hypothetical protein ABK040_004940 [Willaertia magna]
MNQQDNTENNLPINLNNVQNDNLFEEQQQHINIDNQNKNFNNDYNNFYNDIVDDYNNHLDYDDIFNDDIDYNNYYNNNDQNISDNEFNELFQSLQQSNNLYNNYNLYENKDYNNLVENNNFKYLYCQTIKENKYIQNFLQNLQNKNFEEELLKFIYFIQLNKNKFLQKDFLFALEACYYFLFDYNDFTKNKFFNKNINWIIYQLGKLNYLFWNEQNSEKLFKLIELNFNENLQSSLQNNLQNNNLQNNELNTLQKKDIFYKTLPYLIIIYLNELQNSLVESTFNLFIKNYTNFTTMNEFINYFENNYNKLKYKEIIYNSKLLFLYYVFIGEKDKSLQTLLNIENFTKNFTKNVTKNFIKISLQNQEIYTRIGSMLTNNAEYKLSLNYYNKSLQIKNGKYFLRTCINKAICLGNMKFNLQYNIYSFYYFIFSLLKILKFRINDVTLQQVDILFFIKTLDFNDYCKKFIFGHLNFVNLQEVIENKEIEKMNHWLNRVEQLIIIVKNNNNNLQQEQNQQDQQNQQEELKELEELKQIEKEDDMIIFNDKEEVYWILELALERKLNPLVVVGDDDCSDNYCEIPTFKKVFLDISIVD